MELHFRLPKLSFIAAEVEHGECSVVEKRTSLFKGPKFLILEECDARTFGEPHAPCTQLNKRPVITPSITTEQKQIYRNIMTCGGRFSHLFLVFNHPLQAELHALDSFPGARQNAYVTSWPFHKN